MFYGYCQYLWLLLKVSSLEFVCSLFQVSERMKIVDVIGEKVYKDGERIITQVSGDLGQLLSRKSPPVGLVCHLPLILGNSCCEVLRYTSCRIFWSPSVFTSGLCSPFLGFWFCSFGYRFLLTLSKPPSSLLKPGGQRVVYFLSLFGPECLLANPVHSRLRWLTRCVWCL